MYKKVFLHARIVLVVLFTFCSSLLAQVVYEPANNDIYPFLERLTQKGIIEFNNLIKPVSRKYIAEKIIEASKEKIKLTFLEKEEMDFYIKEYGRELKFVLKKFQSERGEQTPMIQNLFTEIYIRDDIGSNYALFSKDKYGRSRFFSYEDSILTININPIIGYDIGKSGGEKSSIFWNGFGFYGYLTNSIGFSFSYSHHNAVGKNLKTLNNISPRPGVIITKTNTNSINYSELHANISIDWSWGEFAIGKDYMRWGYGKSGQLVLSQNAPSFPFMRLEIFPVKWLRFNYFHGWLNSDVIDSSASYPTYREGVNREQYRNKFYASHTITFLPFTGLSFSFGESIIYSDKIELLYLIPIMYFNPADHYVNHTNNDVGSNSQLFFNISSKNHLPNTHLFGTLLIDEMTLGDLFDPERQRTQVGFTLGGSVVDLLVDNLTLSLEYTKIYPFVYRHYIPTQTYESSSYVMGHWIEHNSDIIFGSLNYRIIRGLQATVWGHYVRKGGDGVVDDQYSRPQPPFLFGSRKNTTNYGIEVKYEYIHDLFIRAKYQNNKYSAQQENIDFIDSSESEFTFAIYYGL